MTAADTSALEAATGEQFDRLLTQQAEISEMERMLAS